MSEYVANLSTIFGNLPLDERPAAAMQAGFTRVESWWDFSSAQPSRAEIDFFVGSLTSAGVRLTALNSYGGNLTDGERGLACLPDRTEAFCQSIANLSVIAKRTGARNFNVLFGRLDPTRWSAGDQFDAARNNLTWAASKVAEFGGTLLIEALSGDDAYAFHTGYDAVDFIETDLVGIPDIGLLFDTYHLAANGVDVLDAFADLAPWIRRIQLADFPGRGAPGTGVIDFESLGEAISRSGYRGEIALEYFPG